MEQDAPDRRYTRKDVQDVPLKILTVNIPATLKQELDRWASEDQRTLRVIVERALTEAVNRRLAESDEA